MSCALLCCRDYRFSISPGVLEPRVIGYSPLAFFLILGWVCTVVVVLFRYLDKVSYIGVRQLGRFYEAETELPCGHGLLCGTFLKFCK